MLGKGYRPECNRHNKEEGYRKRPDLSEARGESAQGVQRLERSHKEKLHCFYRQGGSSVTWSIKLLPVNRLQLPGELHPQLRCHRLKGDRRGCGVERQEAEKNGVSGEQSVRTGDAPCAHDHLNQNATAPQTATERSRKKTYDYDGGSGKVVWANKGPRRENYSSEGHTGKKYLDREARRKIDYVKPGGDERGLSHK